MTTEYLKTLSFAMDKIEGSFAQAAPKPAWYSSHSELAYLAGAMESEGYSAREIVQMLEKPSRWTREYEYAQAHAGSLADFDEDPQSLADQSRMDDVGDKWAAMNRVPSHEQE